MGRGELSQCLGSGLVGSGHEVVLEAADQSCLSGGNAGCLVTADAGEYGGGVSEPPGADLDREIDQVATSKSASTPPAIRSASRRAAAAAAQAIVPGGTATSSHTVASRPRRAGLRAVPLRR